MGGSGAGGAGGGLQSQTHVALQQLLGDGLSRRTSLEGGSASRWAAVPQYERSTEYEKLKTLLFIRT